MVFGVDPWAVVRDVHPMDMVDRLRVDHDLELARLVAELQGIGDEVHEYALDQYPPAAHRWERCSDSDGRPRLSDVCAQAFDRVFDNGSEIDWHWVRGLLLGAGEFEEIADLSIHKGYAVTDFSGARLQLCVTELLGIHVENLCVHLSLIHI